MFRLATTDNASARRAHWRATQRWTAGLLGVWFVVSFVVAFQAREWRFEFFGWPFSFWVAAQGALLVYLALVVVYVHVMRRLDEAHDLDEID
jgi:putative solute:sodium symporter small subunit